MNEENTTEPIEEQQADSAIDDDRLKDLKRWRQRVRKARKLRKDWETEYRVKDCEDYYLGKQVKGVPAGLKTINHFLATIRVTIPNLLFDDPKFIARPKPSQTAPGSRDKAKVVEGLLEAIAKQDGNLRNASRLALLQNFFRVGILKVVYDPSLETNPKAGQPIFQQDPAGNVINDPSTGQSIPEINPLDGQPIVEPPQIMSDETYRWEWVDARHMLFPDEGPDQSKWTWIGEEIEVLLEDAKADERFPAELRKNFKSSGKSDEDADADADSDDDDQDACFRYVECYDMRRKQWLIFTESELDGAADDFLIMESLPDGIEDHPYAILAGWIPITGPDPSPWPLPYTQPWIDLQNEYNIRRNQMMEGAKRSARKVLYEQNTFDDEEDAVKALQSNKDMEAVRVRDIARPPTVMQDADLNPSIYQDVPMLLADWRIVTGQTGAKFGVANADTATEATFVEKASNLRDADLQKDVIQWLAIAGKKMLQMVRSTLTLDFYIRLRGMDDQAVGLYLSSTLGIDPVLLQTVPALADAIRDRLGQERMERITRADLIDEVDLDIIPGSTRPRSLSVEREQWLQFLQILASAPQLALSRELLSETAAKFDFISEAMVEEIHALAMTMMQVQAQTAGRGGANQAPQNSPGGNKGAGMRSQAAQGNEMP